MDELEHLQKVGPKGIGGWLVLLAIQITFALFIQTWHAFKLILIFIGDAWPLLTNPQSPSYNWFWKPALIYEFCGHIFFVCYLIPLVILFFNHSRYIPKLFIVLYLLFIAFTVGDLLFSQQIPLFQQPAFAEEAEFAVFRAIIAAAIWIPYFCISERVKNTFVE